MVQLRTALATGCFATVRLWAPLRTAASWIQRVAEVLANPDGADRATVEVALRGVLADVLTHQNDPELAPWATHVYRMTRTY